MTSSVNGACPLNLNPPAIIVAGGKLGVVKKEKPMVENDYFEIACGYGIFIIGSSETGEMQVYAIYGGYIIPKVENYKKFIFRRTSFTKMIESAFFQIICIDICYKTNSS